MTNLSFIGRLIDADSSVPTDSQDRAGYSGHPIGFVYAPTILRWNGLYHLFCCSASFAGGWDQIRHSKSTDGLVWSAPRIVLYASDMCSERSCCDPSVVFFNGYWYLFYSGNARDIQTVMFVARAEALDGPYLKYTRRRTWELNPADPQKILGPMFYTEDNPPAPIPPPPTSGWYGAGQQSVVVKDDILHAWFMDDTLGFPAQHISRIRYSTSVNGVDWTAPVTVKDLVGTDIVAASVDVK